MPDCACGGATPKWAGDHMTKSGLRKCRDYWRGRAEMAEARAQRVAKEWDTAVGELACIKQALAEAQA